MKLLKFKTIMLGWINPDYFQKKIAINLLII